MNVMGRNPQLYELYGPELVLTSTNCQRLHEAAWNYYFAGDYPAGWQA